MIGKIGWVDVHVEHAEPLRNFYSEVVGWSTEAVDMGEYSDFNMIDPASGQANAGVCHARAGNAELPPVWIVYFQVKDLAASIAACEARGGEVISGPRTAGSSGSYAVIRDPAGATCGLIQPS